MPSSLGDVELAVDQPVLHSDRLTAAPVRTEQIYVVMTSRSPQSAQYVDLLRLPRACVSSLHVSCVMVSFTTSPHEEQWRTGAFLRP